MSDGLVNSAAGTVAGFLPPPSENENNTKFVLVKFDDDRVGKKKRTENKAILPNSMKESTPIPQVEVPISLKRSSKITSKRTQFPLTHAWGMTIHKEQGKTEDTLVLSAKGSFRPGQFYTAISRTKTLQGLFITEVIDPLDIKVNQKSIKEINRMREEAPFKPSIPLSIQKSSSTYLKINFLNINSLIPNLPPS